MRCGIVDPGRRSDWPNEFSGRGEGLVAGRPVEPMTGTSLPSDSFATGTLLDEMLITRLVVPDDGRELGTSESSIITYQVYP